MFKMENELIKQIRGNGKNIYCVMAKILNMFDEQILPYFEGKGNIRDASRGLSKLLYIGGPVLDAFPVLNNHSNFYANFRITVLPSCSNILHDLRKKEAFYNLDWFELDRALTEIECEFNDNLDFKTYRKRKVKNASSKSN